MTERLRADLQARLERAADGVVDDIVDELDAWRRRAELLHDAILEHAGHRRRKGRTKDEEPLLRRTALDSRLYAATDVIMEGHKAYGKDKIRE